jgi:hypothetical protein
MTNRVLTKAEREQISAENAAKFRELCPEYIPTPSNWSLFCAFLDSQCGNEFPYTVENYLAAWDFLSDSGVLETRPPSQQQIDIERRRAEAVADAEAETIADLDRMTEDLNQTVRRKEAELRELPLKSLKREAVQERIALRGSRADESGNLRGGIGYARSVVAQKYPQLAPRSSAFARKVAEYLKENQQ